MLIPDLMFYASTPVVVWRCSRLLSCQNTALQNQTQHWIKGPWQGDRCKGCKAQAPRPRGTAKKLLPALRRLSIWRLAQHHHPRTGRFSRGARAKSAWFEVVCLAVLWVLLKGWKFAGVFMLTGG